MQEKKQGFTTTGVLHFIKHGTPVKYILKLLYLICVKQLTEQVRAAAERLFTQMLIGFWRNFSASWRTLHKTFLN